MTPTPEMWFGIVGAVLLLFFFFIVFIVKQYKRCPSNKRLVIFGQVGKATAAQLIHGGGRVDERDQGFQIALTIVTYPHFVH